MQVSLSSRCADVQNAAFKPDTIVHSSQPIGGRDLATYEARLGFSRDNLEGKKVLDLGSGPKVRFATELHEMGILAFVVSMSPDYATKKHAQNAQMALARAAVASPLIAGTGQSLPFQSETFDNVLALNVYEHLGTHRIQTVAEIGRVLTRGGTGLLGPIIDIPGEQGFYAEALRNESLGKTLTEMDIALDQHYIPTDAMPLVRIQDRNFMTYEQPGYVLHIQKAC